jgi:hypothetical protein
MIDVPLPLTYLCILIYCIQESPAGGQQPALLGEGTAIILILGVNV